MSSLRALIFDVDGTLANTERDGHRVAFNLAFAEASLGWRWDETLYGELLAIAGGKERIRFFIDRYQPDWPEPLQTALKAADETVDLDALIADLHRAKTAHYTHLVTQGKIPPRPGVVRLIHSARVAGLRLAIATTSAPDNVMALLQAIFGAESPGWFEVIAAGDIVPAKKPAPDIYTYVLREMGVSPQDCVVFEDSEHGVRAATAAGLPTIVTINEYTEKQDLSEAALVLNHLGDPNNPCEVIAGSVVPSGYVDLTFLQTFRAQRSS